MLVIIFFNQPTDTPTVQCPAKSSTPPPACHQCAHKCPRHPPSLWASHPLVVFCQTTTNPPHLLEIHAKAFLDINISRKWRKKYVHSPLNLTTAAKAIPGQPRHRRRWPSRLPCLHYDRSHGLCAGACWACARPLFTIPHAPLATRWGTIWVLSLENRSCKQF